MPHDSGMLSLRNDSKRTNLEEMPHVSNEIRQMKRISKRTNRKKCHTPQNHNNDEISSFPDRIPTKLQETYTNLQENNYAQSYNYFQENIDQQN